MLLPKAHCISAFHLLVSSLPTDHTPATSQFLQMMGIWMGKKKGRKAASKSVRTWGHCMKQHCHHYNWILEFISIFLMYSLFKSSHSIATFHCNFFSPFEVEHRKENWQASQLKCGERKGLCMDGRVKDAEGKKRTGSKPRGESSKEGTNKGWIGLCTQKKELCQVFIHG